MKFPASGYGWLSLRWLGRRNFNTSVATAGILHKGLRRFRANHYYKVSVILLYRTPTFRRELIFIFVNGDYISALKLFLFKNHPCDIRYTGKKKSVSVIEVSFDFKEQETEQ